MDFLSLPIPLLVAGILIGVVLVVVQLANLRAALVVVAGMFFLSVIAIAKTQWDTVIVQWLYPLQNHRSFLFLGGGVLIGINLLGHSGELASTKKSMQGMILLAIGLYAGLLRLVHEGPLSGLESLVFAMFTVGALVWVVPALIRDWDDIFVLLRTLLITNLVWLGAVAIQFGVNPRAMYGGNQGRFFGLLGNTQHAAVFVGILGAIALWMYLNDPRRRNRMLWMLLFGINMGLLLWTGSRTGMGMVAIGIAVTAYGRLGRSVLLFPAAALLAFGSLQVLEALGIDVMGTAERLTSTDDTRTAAWLTMIASGMRNPLIGVGILNAGDSENSYLYGFAAYGAGMVVMMLILIAVSLNMCRRLFFLRGRMDPARRAIIDLVLGYNLMYFAGALVEGFILARVAGNMVLLVVFGSIGTRILEFAAEEEWAAEAEYDDWDENAEEDWERDGDGFDDSDAFDHDGYAVSSDPV